MMPTYVDGIYFESIKLKNWSLEGGFLYKIAPRGVTQWYFIDKSIGIYPVGVQSNGKPSQYQNQLTSKGIGLLGMERKFKHFKAKIYDMLVENIMNTLMGQLDYTFQDSIQIFQVSAQGIRQDGVGNGGNSDPTKSYFQKNGKSNTFGGRLLYRRKSLEFSLNYNRITNDGQFLLPREWGIEPFFTFLPRERSDGFANVHAYSCKSSWINKNNIFKSSLGFSYVKLPDAKDFAHNKYTMPSYFQLNVENRLNFKGFLKGLELMLLLVYKRNAGKIYDLKNEINKVNMFQINFVSNYNF